jgi:hypothetical protein
MRPICFCCQDVLEISPDEIVQQILDLANWTDFKGYGFLPAIQSAEFEVRTPELVGTRIRVTNADGSKHVEEIVEYRASRELTMQLKEFSPPLARFATYFEEIWNFEPSDAGTKVTRSFKLHARSALTRPLLWMISVFLKKAVARHLAQMRAVALR